MDDYPQSLRFGTCPRALVPHVVTFSLAFINHETRNITYPPHTRQHTQNYRDSITKFEAALKVIYNEAYARYLRHQQQPQQEVEDAAHAFARAAVERELVRRDDFGDTPLLWAAKMGYVSMGT